MSRLLEHDNVSVRFNTSIKEVDGGSLLNRIEFVDTINGNTNVEEFPEGSFGIFVFTGNDPLVDIVRDYVELGPDGGVVTDDSMMTKTPGLFCVGDMRTKQLRQVITAAADYCRCGGISLPRTIGLVLFILGEGRTQIQFDPSPLYICDNISYVK